MAEIAPPWSCKAFEVFELSKGVLDPHSYGFKLPVELLLTWVELFAFEGVDRLLASHVGLVPNDLLFWSQFG